ncbi:MAG: molecular chaperone Tir [Candidatus Heimdallarchaeota archaeon]|nr:molecular chaperone Tir [Candidatus Heimdallarchaeota archaeon]
MSRGKIVRVFISHSWDHSDDYVYLVNFLRKIKDFQFYNYSVPKHDPLKAGSDKELLDELCEQLRGCHILIILATMRPTYSDWIQKEILIANVYNKPVLAIIPRGQKRYSLFIKNYCDKVVKWHSKSITKAIYELLKIECELLE